MSSPASATRKRKDHPFGWSFLFWLAKQALTDLRVMRPTSVARCGERPDRRRWRMQGGERVAGVGEGRRCTATEDIRRAPQQGILRLPYQQGQTVVLLNRVLPPQPENSTDLDIGAEKSETTTVSDFFYKFSQLIFIDILCRKQLSGRT